MASFRNAGPAAFLQPTGEEVAAGVGPGRGIEGRLVVCVGGAGVDVGAGCEEPFGCPPLSAVAGLPERFVQIRLGGRRDRVEEFVEPGEHPQGRGVPEGVYRCPALDKQPGDVPAAVADGVVQGSADGAARDLQVGAAVDERGMQASLTSRRASTSPDSGMTGRTVCRRAGQLRGRMEGRGRS